MLNTQAIGDLAQLLVLRHWGHCAETTSYQAVYSATVLKMHLPERHGISSSWEKCRQVSKDDLSEVSGLQTYILWLKTVLIYLMLHMYIMKYNTLEHGEGPEKWSVLHVALESRIRSPILRRLFLQYGNPTHMSKQEPEEERRRHAEVLRASHDRGCRQEQP